MYNLTKIIDLDTMEQKQVFTGDIADMIDEAWLLDVITLAEHSQYIENLADSTELELFKDLAEDFMHNDYMLAEV